MYFAIGKNRAPLKELFDYYYVSEAKNVLAKIKSFTEGINKIPELIKACEILGHTMSRLAKIFREEHGYHRTNEYLNMQINNAKILGFVVEYNSPVNVLELEVNGCIPGLLDVNP